MSLAIGWRAPGGGSGALSTLDLAFQLGAAFVGDPDTLGLSNGAPVSTMSDAMTGAIQLAAGAHPFLADTVHLLNGHTAIATNGAVHTLGNTGYSPRSVAGAAPTAWNTAPWTLVAVVNCVTVAAVLGGGPYVGTEGTAKAGLNVGGGAFGAGAAGQVFYAVDTSGGAPLQWPFSPQASPSGAMIVALSFDGARFHTMTNGASDVADGAAATNIISTPIAAPGFGLSDGEAGNVSGTNYWYHWTLFPSCLARTSLRIYQRSLAVRFGLVS